MAFLGLGFRRFTEIVRGLGALVLTESFVFWKLILDLGLGWAGGPGWWGRLGWGLNN